MELRSAAYIAISISTTHLSPHRVADGRKHPKNTCMFKIGCTGSGEWELKLLKQIMTSQEYSKAIKTGLQIMEQQIKKRFSDSRGNSGIMWLNGRYANALLFFFFSHDILPAFELKIGKIILYLLLN